MPYRIQKGDRVLLLKEDPEGKGYDESSDVVIFNRTVDFEKKELVASPLDEHNNDGIPFSMLGEEWVWGFNVRDKWEDGGEIIELYASEVHTLKKSTPKKAKTVTVQGSGTNQYTITLNDDGDPIECSCRGYRFTRAPCKHMRQYQG